MAFFSISERIVKVAEDRADLLQRQFTKDRFLAELTKRTARECLPLAPALSAVLPGGWQDASKGG